MTTRDTPEAVLTAALLKDGRFRDGPDMAMTKAEAQEYAGEYAVAILAALDGWTLMTVPSPGESAGYDREQAEIARLAALEQGVDYERARIAEAVRRLDRFHQMSECSDCGAEEPAECDATEPHTPWFDPDQIAAVLALLAPPDYSGTFGIIADAIEAGDEGPG